MGIPDEEFVSGFTGVARLQIGAGADIEARKTAGAADKKEKADEYARRGQHSPRRLGWTLSGSMRKPQM